MPSEMTQTGCPYLVRKKTAFRASLDLGAAAPASIIVTWYCRHPFHGMALELGDSRHEAEYFCAACPLPGQAPDGRAG
jgi:phosphatidylserine/phosphatidylglycerophosphate/cardiolipin synthase-like enzyme